MSKLKSKKDLPLYQICICAKQCLNPSYKAQLLVKNLCKELYVNLIGLIILASQNSCRYAFTITNSCSKYCWVKNLHEKREAGSAFRKFITFIENQTNRKVKRVRINKGRKFTMRKLQIWEAKKGIKIEDII